MKKLSLIFIFCIYANASNPISLQYIDIDVKHTYSNNKEEIYKIQREINKDCLNIPTTPESFENENISKNIPNECKKTLITTSGVIQPLFINDEIDNSGNKEVSDDIMQALDTINDDFQVILVTHKNIEDLTNCNIIQLW